MEQTAVRRAPASGLLAASHPGPAAAVTAVAALLAVSAEKGAGTVALVAAAVLAGQLSIGWGNDLVDVSRDRATARADKPLARGDLAVRPVALALGVAAATCLGLSVLLGGRAAVVHLVCVSLGHAYNLGLKTTALSWAPYAGAFGLLPSVASLAGTDPAWAPWWATAAGAALGVGAHLVNVLPDLADDEATGVRGLPHRLGATRARVGAALLLALASLLAVLGPAGRAPAWAFAVLAGIAALTLLAVGREGRWPFRAAMAVALLDVVLLVAAGP